MHQSSSIVMFTCFCMAAACGGSKNEPDTAADVAAEREFEASAEPEAHLATPPDPNSTQLTLDTELMEQCGLKEAKLYFPYDSTEVKGNGDDEVRSMANCVVSGNLRGKELVLVGHTDPRGTEQYNEELGKSRAESVADVLISAGIPRDKLVIRSAGESAASSDKEDWPTDRRVEVAIVME